MVFQTLSLSVPEFGRERRERIARPQVTGVFDARREALGCAIVDPVRSKNEASHGAADIYAYITCTVASVRRVLEREREREREREVLLTIKEKLKVGERVRT